jgi:hypothetical protein
MVFRRRQRSDVKCDYLNGSGDSDSQVIRQVFVHSQTIGAALGVLRETSNLCPTSEDGQECAWSLPAVKGGSR